MLLAAGSFYVYLDVRRHKSGGGCTRSWLPPARRWRNCAKSLRPADDDFGKVADLKSVTTESPAAGPNPAAKPPLLPSGDMTAPLEPLGRMLPAARFAAPPGEAIAGLDLRNLPHRLAAAAIGTEPIEIQPLHAAGQPSAPRNRAGRRRRGRCRGGRRALPPLRRRCWRGRRRSRWGVAGGPRFAGRPGEAIAGLDVPRFRRTAAPWRPSEPSRSRSSRFTPPAACASQYRGDRLSARTAPPRQAASSCRCGRDAGGAGVGTAAGSGGVARKGRRDWSRRLGQGSAGDGFRGGVGLQGAAAPLGTASDAHCREIGSPAAVRGPRR